MSGAAAEGEGAICDLCEKHISPQTPPKRQRSLKLWAFTVISDPFQSSWPGAICSLSVTEVQKKQKMKGQNCLLMIPGEQLNLSLSSPGIDHRPLSLHPEICISLWDSDSAFSVILFNAAWTFEILLSSITCF